MRALFTASDNTVGIAVVSLIFIVGGYLLLVGLFYVIVYRPSRAARRAERLESEPFEPQGPEIGAEPPDNDPAR